MPAWWAIPLVVAGAVIVLIGAAAGWTATRAIAGQAPLSTVTVTTDRAPLVTHTDALGFAVGVPESWSQYRYQSADGGAGVRFVSSDGTEELSVQRGTSADAVLAGLTAEKLGVESVVAEPPTAVEGASPAVRQVTYRTTEASLTRSTWLRIVPAGADGSVWALRLTVPGDRTDGPSAGLFDVVAAGFVASGT
jgi:hypothetical protein